MKRARSSLVVLASLLLALALLTGLSSPAEGAFVKRADAEDATVLQARPSADAQNKVTLAVQMKRLKEESSEDFAKARGRVDEGQALSNTMSTSSFNNILASCKRHFSLACSSDSACLDKLTDKITTIIQARLDMEAASDPASKAKGIDGEYVSLKNVFEIEAAIKTLYSKAQDKLLLLGQFENDAATAKDYKGAATMKRNYVELKTIIDTKFKGRTPCNATSTEPECSVAVLQRTYGELLESLTEMKDSGALAPKSTSPSSDPLMALLKIYEDKWHSSKTSEQQKTVLVFIMEQIRKAMELQNALAGAVKEREWDRAHVLQEYASNAERALIAKLTSYYRDHGEKVNINATDVASQAAEAAVSAILQAETSAKQARDDIATKCALVKMVVKGAPPAQAGCSEQDTDFGCTFDVADEQSMWVRGGANGCSGTFSCYGQIVECKAAPRAMQTCACTPPPTTAAPFTLAPVAAKVVTPRLSLSSRKLRARV